MYYHFATMLLFRPFTRLRIINSHISPRDICLHAIISIHRLLRSYSQLYTLRRVPSFVPYFVLFAGVTQLAVSPSSDETVSDAASVGSQASDAVIQCIADLDEMASLHPFAKTASNILRYLVYLTRDEQAPGSVKESFLHHIPLTVIRCRLGSKPAN